MTKNTAVKCFLLLFLLLSFLLMNFAFLSLYLPAGVVAADAPLSGTDGSASINLSFRYILDYTDVESVSPRFCANRAASSGRQFSGRGSDLYSALSAPYSPDLAFGRVLDDEWSLSCPERICEFMHAKDGML